ncbi:unnamed protein product [Rhizophagus irregularis]|nr:unnamed protein product [Rhizophagus irregularis]
MWEFETINPIKHVLRISENPSSMNKWITLITVLSSLLEAVLLPVLISLTWIAIYKIKRRMNGSEFRLCMQATHGNMFKLFTELIPRHKRLSMIMFGFIILLSIMVILGKNIPNVLLAQVIGLYNFTEISHINVNLFRNDSNCTYTSCLSDLDEDNFALVKNSTTLKNTLRMHNVKNTYLNLSVDNTLYAVRVKINTTSCGFAFNDYNKSKSLSSQNMDNVTDTTFIPTYVYEFLVDTYRYFNGLTAYQSEIGFNINIQDRCDIPFNMLYISPNFNPNVTKLGNLIKSRFDVNRSIGRTCRISFGCSASVEWKNMQIVGTTPDNIKLLKVDFNNSLYKLEELFSTNVRDYRKVGKCFGEGLMDNTLDKMVTFLTDWRETIKYKGGKYNYNLLNEFENVLSQSLVSSVQSMTNDINVYTVQAKKLEAPGIWIEMTILSLAIFFVCSILMLILTTRNVKMLLPLSVLDLGIITNVIFKEDGSNTKTSWPFELDSYQDESTHLLTANEIS